MILTTIEQVLVVLAHPIMMMVYGLLAHFGTKLMASNLHQTKHRACITDYWKANPTQTLLTLVGAFVGYITFIGTEMHHSEDVLHVLRTSAFGIGYMADNIADRIGENTLRKIGGGGP